MSLWRDDLCAFSFGVVVVVALAIGIVAFVGAGERDEVGRLQRRVREGDGHRGRRGRGETGDVGGIRVGRCWIGIRVGLGGGGRGGLGWRGGEGGGIFKAVGILRRIRACLCWEVVLVGWGRRIAEGGAVDESSRRVAMFGLVGRAVWVCGRAGARTTAARARRGGARECSGRSDCERGRRRRRRTGAHGGGATTCHVPARPLLRSLYPTHKNTKLHLSPSANEPGLCSACRPPPRVPRPPPPRPRRRPSPPRRRSSIAARRPRTSPRRRARRRVRSERELIVTVSWRLATRVQDGLP